MKMRFCAIFTAFLAVMCLAGCGQAKPDVLVVAVPQSTGSQCKSSIRRAMRQLGLEMDVEVIEMPSQSLAEGDEAEQLQTQMRTELMAGEGADLFLLDSYQHLLPDVIKTAQNGAFYDLAPLLDETLAEKNVIQPVMDAGVIDGKRYFVPLAFDLQGITARQSWLDGWQPAADTPGGMAQAFLERTGGKKALLSELLLESCPSPMLDTAAKTISLSPQQEEVLDYYSRTHALPWAQTGDDKFYQDTLYNFMLDYAQDQELVFLPVPNGAGGYTAQVSLMAAVRANSPLAEEAAAIIAELLNPEPVNSTTGAPCSPCGYPALPVGRDALQQYCSTDCKGNPVPKAGEWIALADQINAVWFCGDAEWDVRNQMLAAMREGRSAQDAMADVRQKYRYYFEE